MGGVGRRAGHLAIGVGYPAARGTAGDSGRPENSTRTGIRVIFPEMSGKPTNGQAAGDAEPTASTGASPGTSNPITDSTADPTTAGSTTVTPGTPGPGAPDSTGSPAAASAGDSGQDDIAIEVETGDPGPGDGEPGDDEIAVEVDTRESDAAERIAQLEAEKADIEKQRQDNWERLLRATADLDNFRKRARRDVDDARIDSRTKVLRPMLEVIDNLERAVDHAESVDNPEKAHAAILEGVKLVLRQFGQVLERFDVKAVAAVGEPFDPNLHEAISQVESADFVSGSVINAPQKGYTIGDRLLRPSLVVVSKGPPAGSEAGSAPDGSPDGSSADGSADGAEGPADGSVDAGADDATAKASAAEDEIGAND